LAIIFNKLGIDTEAVLEAAGTKWNFLPFRPGLVGGHCIGVDPYYLTHKSIEVGYSPEIILAGRRLNDNISSYIVQKVSELMLKNDISIIGSNVLILGLTFKENCPDLRNSGVVGLVKGLEGLSCNVDVYDPWSNKNHAHKEYDILPVSEPVIGKYDAIVIAVAHDEFKKLSVEEIRAYGKENHVLYDIKYILNENQSDGRL
jgi:nucleotide sugar dehydrogenase